MTAIEGMKDHPLWHNPDGSHRHPHPKTYQPSMSYWTGVERRYAAHLDRHQELIENPEPMKGDSAAILSLFEHMEHLKQIIEKEKLLIQALRQRASEHPEADELEMNGLRKAIRREGS